MKSIKVFILSFSFLTLAIQCNKEKSKNTDCTPIENKDCVCIEIYDPVCGCDSITYSNSCFAECAEVTYTAGTCK